MTLFIFIFLNYDVHCPHRFCDAGKELKSTINNCARMIANHVCHCNYCKQQLKFNDIDIHSCSDIGKLTYISPKTSKGSKKGIKLTKTSKGSKKGIKLTKTSKGSKKGIKLSKTSKGSKKGTKLSKASKGSKKGIKLSKESKKSTRLVKTSKGSKKVTKSYIDI